MNANRTLSFLLCSIYLFSLPNALAKRGKKTTKKPPKVRSLKTKPQMSQVQQVERFHNDYTKASQDYLKEVGAYTKKELREMRKKVQNIYAARMSHLDTHVRKARKLAIQRFTAFIRKYPKHGRFTPDAIYRLAELYYEEEFTAYLERAKVYERELVRFENKVRSSEPLEPKKHFPQTTYWLSRLIRTFPRYRHLASAYYLLGYCKHEEGSEKKAQQFFRTIVKTFHLDDPSVRKEQTQLSVVIESWMRLGEYFFRKRQSKKAKRAYLQLLKFPKHHMYDKALYKLAWLHYIDNEFKISIKHFVTLLRHYHRTGRAGKGALYKEALQYVANSLFDESWGGPKQAIGYFAKQIGINSPFSRKILVSLANNYFKMQDWKRATVVHQALLQLYRFHPGNLQIHERLIQAFERQMELKTSLAYRRQQLKRFGKRSKWYKKNVKNVQAMRDFRRLYNQNAYRIALFQHEHCNVLRNQASKKKTLAEKLPLLRRAMHSCRDAAKSYQQYLRQNTHSKKLYELTWYMGDSQYFGGLFLDAAATFRKVRDWSGKKRYRLNAAYSLVDALQQQLRLYCQKGTIVRGCKKGAKEPKKTKQQKIQVLRRRVKKLPIHPLHKRLLAAKRTFIQMTRKKRDKRRPYLMYQVAHTYYIYRHLGMARLLLQRLLREFPKHSLSKEAGRLLVLVYNQEGRTDEILTLLRRLKSQKIQLPGNQDTEMGILFAKANHYQKQGKPELAAKTFIQAARTHPKHKDAPASLWNAALLFEKAQMLQKAKSVYQMIIKHHPNWVKADQATFYLAYNAEKLFQFSEAIRVYSKLIRMYPLSNKRAHALHNTVVLLEHVHRYEEAARARLRYQRLFRGQPDAPKMLFQAGLLYRKMKKFDEMKLVFKRFIRTYTRESKQRFLVLRAHYIVSQALQRQLALQKPKSRAAKRLRRRLNKQYAKLKSLFSNWGSQFAPLEKRLAMAFVAESVYHMEMKNYRAFARFRITTRNPRRQQLQAKKLFVVYQKVSQGLQKVYRYKSPRWAVCTMAQLGKGRLVLIDVIKKAPLPNIQGMVWNEETIETYRDSQYEKLIRPLEEQAIRSLKKAIQTGQRFRLKKGCVKEAYRELARLDPSYAQPKGLKFQHNPSSPLPPPALSPISQKSK